MSEQKEKAMDPIAGRLRPPAPTDSASVAARLERGELISLSSCPFAIPEGDDRTFLFEQRLDGTGPKHIGYDRRRCRTYGFVPAGGAQADRLQYVLGQTAEHATGWLDEFLPWYAGAAELEYVAFHPEEEATRKLGTLERNDLLHVDVPSDESRGRRLLRLYVNLHPTDARVWQTSLAFAELLERYGAEVGLPGAAETNWWRPLRLGLRRLWQAGRTPSAPFEGFMLRLHDFLKQHDGFQERAPKKCRQLGAGAAWLVFTDGVAHAELRGRFVLEFAFLVQRHALACPELSPYAQFEGACGVSASGVSTSGTVRKSHAA